MDSDDMKVKVNSEYSRSKVAGQPKAFGAWAKKVREELVGREPRLAERLDLSRGRTCDRLHQHFELDLQTPEQAAAAIQAELAKNPDYLPA